MYHENQGSELERTPDAETDVETPFVTPSDRTNSMEKALWYLFAGSRGGANRVRIVRELADRPRNANELADELDLNYNTIDHHLDMLEDHNVVEPSEHDYGKLYFLTDQFEQHQETFETISEEVS
ncbi:regulatory protein, arsR family [Halovenus aranensis]|uniref:Regulatory protein, arsR family n=2 Tax=Halovenus aranensis TaxID=890420 RepID=A0A1G8SN73_9EURY|nr:regulatory protein, arsR family [Halovenus aranensis]